MSEVPAGAGAARTGWRRLLEEPRRPVGVAGHPGAHWFVLATVCVGAFLGQLDASIVTLALPTLQRVFGASVGAVSWVGLSYLLVLVASVAAVGRLADMVGRKLLYTYGFVVFVVGSALCGLAPGLGALDGFRALQAVGAAMLQANSVAIITVALPRRVLGRGIGIQGAAQALGLALGPTVGGLLLSAGGWRLVFLVNVPVGLVGTVAAWVLIPRSRHLQPRAHFDWGGLALFATGVLALLGGLSFGNELGWASPRILGLLALAGVLAAAFVARERRCPAPMIDLSLFERGAFAVGISSGVLSYLVMFGVLFVVPFYLERARHLGAGQAGFRLTVMPVALAVVAPFAGRMADRVGSRALTAAGMAVTAMGLGLLATGAGGTGVFLVELAAVGVGLGMFTPSNNAAVMAAATPGQSGVAGGVLNATRGLGTSLGLALTAAVYTLGGGPTAGFRFAALFLAVVATAAAGLARLRSPGPAVPSWGDGGRAFGGGGRIASR